MSILDFNGFEKKVLRLLSDGLIKKEVAKELGVSLNKVLKTCQNLRDKYKCNMMKIVSDALRKKIIE